MHDRLPVQLLLAQQIWPSAPQAVQAPLRHSRPAPQLPLLRFWQVPVPQSWHSPPQLVLQHLPATQLPDWHWPPALQVVPLPSNWRQLPPMQARFWPFGQLLPQQGWLTFPQAHARCRLQDGAVRAVAAGAGGA